MDGELNRKCKRDVKENSAKIRTKENTLTRKNTSENLMRTNPLPRQGDASQPPIPPTPIPSDVLQTLLTFALVFRFEDRVKSLEVNFSEFMRTNQSTEAVYNISDSIQRENHEFLRTIDDNMKKIIKGQVKNQVNAQVTRILPRIKESVNAQLEAEVLIRSSHSSRTSYAVAADLSEMELKKTLIDKMEGNKSIQRSDEQRNLYKALVEAYDADKTILDSYGESAILKRRREDDDDQERPSVGLDWGSKRRREGGEHASGSTLSEPATEKEPVQTTCQMEEPSHPVFETGSEDQPIVQTSQNPEWFSQPRKPPTPNRDWNKTLPAVQGNAQSWISALAKQTDARSSFNELLDTPIDFSNFIMNRLDVDTLTPELLAGPTYELMKGSCNSLIELEYHLEEVTKRQRISWIGITLKKRLNLTKPDTYRSDLKRCEAYTAYSNPQGFIYQNKDKKNRLMRIDELHKYSDGTLNDVRNALDDRLKGIRMQYLPSTIWRKGDKDRAAAMIQAIKKMLKTRRIMRSLEKFVGGRLYEGDLRMLQRTI
nr:hypothetical protein [Tanacetum cinerariifolium]